MCMCTCIYYRNNIQSRFQCISLISLRNTAYKKGNPCTASHFHTFFKTLKFHHGCLEVCFNHNVDLCVISVYLLIYVFVSSIWQHYKVSYNLATLTSDGTKPLDILPQILVQYPSVRQELTISKMPKTM